MSVCDYRPPERVRHQHGGHCAASWNGARLVFAITEPRSGSDNLDTQVNDVLDDIEAVLQPAGSLASVYHQVIFAADPAILAGCQQALESRYQPHLPATTWVHQPPLSGRPFAVEAWSALSDPSPVTINRLGEGLVQVGLGDLGLVFSSHLEARPGTLGVFNQTVSTLSRVRAHLARAGVGFDQILRTWFYLGGITEHENLIERYHEMNRARAAFYEGVDFLALCRPPGQLPATVYPASTGIGTSGQDIRISALALHQVGPGWFVRTIENPRQTSAFQYASNYSPKSPQFARALALSNQRDALIMVSGTASITGAESRHLGDVAAQTHQTLDNIEALISESNLSAHGLPGHGARLDDLVQARIYLKQPADAPVMCSLIEERLPGLSTIQTQADICRSELLVEIEGIIVKHLS